MQVKIRKPGGYSCAPDGHTVVTIAQGAICEGRAAQMALADKAGQAVKFDPRTETKVIEPSETKATPKKRGRPRKTDK